MIERERPKRPPFVSTGLLIGGIAAALCVVFLIVFVALWSTVASVDVPDVTGLPESAATTALQDAGLQVEIVERIFDPAPPGTVLFQAPGAGESVPEDTIVALRVSAGTEEFELPDVMGMTLRAAQAQLEARGLMLRIDSVDADAPPDTIIASNPSPGALVRTGDIVRLTVAMDSGTTSGLVPFGLDGAMVVLDPVPDDAIEGDPTLEMARKLRSLLEAS
ncbi:MAG: PASTA domain-containing protein, partial [Coriobacteriia bacterium]|nr:PASTA domain-containing protein [Coriobacteriia bacterium]